MRKYVPVQLFHFLFFIPYFYLISPRIWQKRTPDENRGALIKNH